MNRQVVFKSAQLLYPSVIFAEAPNLIFYADAQVLAKLHTIIRKETNGHYGALFPGIRDGLMHMDYPSLHKMVQTKLNHNILYDLVDWAICLNRKGKDQSVFSYLDHLYRILLYQTDEIPVHFTGTSIGYALKTLVVHENMKKLILYISEENRVLQEDLSQLFKTSSEKLELVYGGEIGTAIYASNADTFFLNHIQDVDHIMMIPEIKPREIYLPSYAYNQEIDADLTEEESQVSYFDRFQLSINYIHLPF